MRPVRRTNAYATCGTDALFFTGVNDWEQLAAIQAAANGMPIILGGTPASMADTAPRRPWRARRTAGPPALRRRHQAVYETLKALREGQSPKTLKGLASSDLTDRVMREAEVKARGAEWLGLRK